MTVLVGHTFELIPSAVLPFIEPLITDGVSMFFVLSGFLIGGILIKTLETRPASGLVLLDFWIKRWFRTVPPYLLALVLLLVVYKLTVPGFIIRDKAYYFVFFQNFNWPHPAFFPESWSLAIEEWFYLISASSIFLLATRVSPKKAVLAVAVIILVGCTFYRYIKFQHAVPVTLDDWDYSLRKQVLTRLDTLMYGVLAAYISHYFPTLWRKKSLLLLIIGIGMLLASVSIFKVLPPSSLYISVFYFTQVGLGSALLLPFLSQWQTARGPIAASITHISLISYSLYLLHFSLLLNAFLIPSMPKLPGSALSQQLIALVIFWVGSLTLATLSYKYFEVPTTHLRRFVKLNIPSRKGDANHKVTR